MYMPCFLSTCARVQHQPFQKDVGTSTFRPTDSPGGLGCPGTVHPRLTQLCLGPWGIHGPTWALIFERVKSILSPSNSPVLKPPPTPNYIMTGPNERTKSAEWTRCPFHPIRGVLHLEISWESHRDARMWHCQSQIGHRRPPLHGADMQSDGPSMD